jgi:aryl-alcohol dehydrogenase-like predicted oxidoreductase
MEYSRLGGTSLEVSRFALGTMTFGGQNTPAEAHAQLDRALDAGINLIDTAELYPSPATATSYGESERILGDWLRADGRRERVLIASKVAGPAAFAPWIRGGRSRHDAANLEAAVAGSLARLRTDRIDLLQLHWPDRATNCFGQRGFKPARREAPFDPEATLAALAGLIASGKVRAIGVCNETPWGLAEFLHLARAGTLPRLAAIQNPYSLLNRGFEAGLAEVAWREGCDLIAYSPLACGMLTGKYLDVPAPPPSSRLALYRQYRRYASGPARAATARYLAIARAHGLDPVHMALAFVASKPWVASVIIGATSVAQLEHNLRAVDVRLPRDVTQAIDAVHEEIPNPCP